MTTGRLLLGATPLGQPSDASPRLLDALARADVVAAEDTRRVRTLAKALDVAITGRVISMFDRVEAARVDSLLEAIRSGATVLVVSDAGMPVISDPGFRLVTACVQAGLPVGCLPGPSAVMTALAVSGLPAEKFCFEASHRERRRRGAAGWTRWPTSGAPACSSNHRAGCRPACRTRWSGSAVSGGPRSAGS